MKTLLRPWILAAAFGLLSLSACVSLASDVTPPPNYVPPVTQPPADAEAALALPMMPPDPQAGAPIYAEKCLPCHGATGLGDGFQAGNLPNPPPAIGDSALAHSARPVDWFAIVTQGNLQNMMPGFSGSLNDRQRWDVVAYALSLSMNPATLQQGAQLYVENCQECHGADGRGDGSAAVPDWSDPARLAQLSAEEMRAIVLQGKGEMPAFEGKLDEAGSWAVTEYTRTLSFASAPLEQAAQPQTTAQPATGTQSAETPVAAATMTIEGRIVNASGGEVPAGLEVTLLGYDNMQPALEETASAQPDGSFTFADLEYNPDRVFLATVKVGEYTFNSDVLHAADVLPGASPLMLHIYDTSSDASGLVAERMHVFFDFSKEGVVQVGELLIVTNPTNQMIVPAAPGEPVIRFTLPEGAANLNFQDGVLGERFVETDGGFGDTLAIQPGNSNHQVLFAYELPYNRKLDVRLTPPMPVNASVLIVPAGGVKLVGDKLQDSGEKPMQGVNVHLYTAGPLAAGEALDVSLTGRSGTGGSVVDVSSQAGLFVGLGALLLALVGAGVWFWRRRAVDAGEDEDEEETEASAPASVESLLDAIVALDDQYQSGQLSQEAYEQRRAALKEQLRIAREQQG